jgi:hypothetical protein
MRRIFVVVVVGLVAAGVVAYLALPPGPPEQVTAGSASATPPASAIPPPSPAPSPAPSATETAWAGPPLACTTLPVSFTASPLPGSPVRATVSLAGATASLAGEASSVYGIPALSSPILAVTQAGMAPVSETVAPPKASATTNIIPWSIGPEPQSNQALCIAKFAGQALPTVVLGLDLGGAHCCTVLRAYQLLPGAVAPPADDDLGNPGAALQPVGDHAVVITADNAFAYTFDSFAGSGMPILVLDFSAGRFADVTRLYPDQITADAARWWSALNTPTGASPGGPSIGLGVLAPWVADECLLGQEPHAWSTVATFESEGKLGGEPASGVLWPTGQAYVTALRSFLRQHGYCP